MSQHLHKPPAPSFFRFARGELQLSQHYTSQALPDQSNTASCAFHATKLDIYVHCLRTCHHRTRNLDKPGQHHRFSDSARL